MSKPPTSVIALRPSPMEIYALAFLKAIHQFNPLTIEYEERLTLENEAAIRAINDAHKTIKDVPDLQHEALQREARLIVQTWNDVVHGTKQEGEDHFAMRRARLGRFYVHGERGGLIPSAVTSWRMGVDYTWRFQDVNPSQAPNIIGPAIDRNSCAIDVTFMAMVRMDAGILSFDLLPPDIRGQPRLTNNPFHFAARVFAAESDLPKQDLREVLEDQRRRCRDAALDHLNKTNYTKYDIGDELPVGSILDFALSGLMQVTWLEVHGSLCDNADCLAFQAERRGTDQKYWTTYKSVLSTGYWVEDRMGAAKEQTVEGHVRAYFLPHPPAGTKDDACGKCGAHTVPSVCVAGCLPPRLVVEPALNGFHKGECTFGDIDIDYFVCTADGTVEVATENYRLIGFIVHSQTGIGHFTLCWRHASDQWSQYDDTVRRGVCTGPDDLDRLLERFRGNADAGTSISALIYERTDLFTSV